MDERSSRPSRCTPTSGARARRPPHDLPPVVEELKAEARSRGLWNLFLPGGVGSGLSTARLRAAGRADRARSPRSRPRRSTAPRRTPATWRCCACSAPPSRSSAGSSRCWTGEIRSGFAMTEPDVASSRRDATSRTTIVRDGDEYVINGRKWWTHRRGRRALRGADRDGRHRPGRRRAPRSSRWCWCRWTPPASTVVRAAGVRLPRPARPRRDRLRRRPRAGGEPARRARATASPIAQARLGPGRIHHCMRADRHGRAGAAS